MFGAKHILVFFEIEKDSQKKTLRVANKTQEEGRTFP